MKSNAAEHNYSVGKEKKNLWNNQICTEKAQPSPAPTHSSGLACTDGSGGAGAEHGAAARPVTMKFISGIAPFLAESTILISEPAFQTRIY